MLPDETKSITHKFSIGGHEGYITVGMYEAWACEQAIAAFGEQLIANLEAFVEGQPQNLIV